MLRTNRASWAQCRFWFNRVPASVISRPTGRLKDQVPRDRLVNWVSPREIDSEGMSVESSPSSVLQLGPAVLAGNNSSTGKSGTTNPKKSSKYSPVRTSLPSASARVAPDPETMAELFDHAPDLVF